MDGPLIDSISALEECFYDGRWNMRCLTGIGVATWAIADSGLIPILEEWWDDTMTTAFENWNVPTCESCGIGGSTDIGVCVGGSVCVTSALDVNYSDELGYGVAASFGFNFGTETIQIVQYQIYNLKNVKRVKKWMFGVRPQELIMIV